jgi:protocatechuate 4,5-dioxygenase alpha subunit
MIIVHNPVNRIPSAAMPSRRDYDDIPGTIVFDGQQARRGYALNKFLMSLNQPANREAFMADEAAYLDRFTLDDEQREAVLGRQWLRLLEVGGNVYYTYKLAACDGMTFQDLAGELASGERLMARVAGGVGCSHVPAVGAAIDKGRTEEPYWAPYFAKLDRAREWIAEVDPDVCIVVYNDHANAFSLEVIPTFALGLADEFPPADEGYGPRPVPVVQGHPELAWHLAESLILDEFDLTLVNEMPVDHGLTVPLSVMFGQPEAWPCAVIPLCVNVVQYPPPTGHRCYRLGQALRRALESYEGAERVVVFGTGGMSHQLQAERAGFINVDFDTAFLDHLVDDPEAVAAIPHLDYLRDAGSEGIELVMWLVMRGALGPRVREVYRATHLPTSNTHNGLLILEEAS